MNVKGQTICLSMIVKNEAPVIARCLSSLRPMIDHWVIVDTGSTDGTQDAIRTLLGDLPGELHERPWRDFAHNRNEALELAKPHADYALIIDADDLLEFEPGFQMPALQPDSYVLRIVDNSISYKRTQIVRAALPWQWRGVLHEFLSCDDARTSALLEGVSLRRNHDGARRRDAETYERDAQILEAALQTEIDPFLRSRYQFYLAQSYRDCDEKEKALQAYLRRAELGFWDEEVFVSFCWAARLQESLGRPFEEVTATYLRASDAVPGRAEALHGASRHCRNARRYAEGYEIAKRGLGLEQPADGLFVEPWIYQYGLLDEFAVNAYWAGHYRECLEACEKILARETIPAHDRERVANNAEFATNKLREASLAGKDLPKHLTNGVASWAPRKPAGGTELMVAGLQARLGHELDAINLTINHPGHDRADNRARVVWMHHDADQEWVQWCRDGFLVESVSCFVFVSNWQRERYLAAFDLPPERCLVLRNAVEVGTELRPWKPGDVWRCAYTSTPFRGLSVLLEAWERLKPAGAELHIWSSMKLYLADDEPYDDLYDRARSMPGVSYHGVVPNPELRTALRRMDFLVYPCTFPETSCLAAIEAMAAGCRVIVPSLGALPETTCGYARLYPWIPDPRAHAAALSEILANEMALPWTGEPELSAAQQRHAAAVYDWRRRELEWRQLIATFSRAPEQARPS